MSRQGPHHIGTTGAVDKQALIYDSALDEYRPQAVPASGVQSVVAGSNVTVDNTDPLNPVVSATAPPSAKELLMASGVSFPAEPLESSSGGDWLYGEVP